MGSEPEQSPGLTREAVVQGALRALDELGVDGLSMRGLADRLGVKAASLYWHIRDKDQLLQLLVEELVDRVEVPTSPPGWRPQVSAACAALAQVVREHPATAPVLLTSLPAVQRSRLARELIRVLEGAGSDDPAGAAFALLVTVVASAGASRDATAAPRGGSPVTLRIDSGSWRVAVRAAAPGTVDVAASVGGGGAPHLDIQDGEVVVRNRRGGNRGAVELSPEHSWAIKVHGGTWNTSLDLSGLRVTSVELDSGAGNLTCVLPEPHGKVPVRVNSGIVGVTVRRPRGTALHADVATGSVKVRCDGRMLRATATDVSWDSPGAERAEDRYDVTVASGCVKVTLDDSAPATRAAAPAPPTASPAGPQMDRPGRLTDLILDGIEARLARLG